LPLNDLVARLPVFSVGNNANRDGRFERLYPVIYFTPLTMEKDRAKLAIEGINYWKVIFFQINNEGVS
jgi:hypothetical protein